MVTTGQAGEEQTIKLEMTIDKAELERQLGQVFGGNAGGSGGGGGGGGGGSSRAGTKKPTMVDAAGGMMKKLKYLGALAGIAITLGALLKLSKVMAAATHAINSVLGAMVDSFLAPFMPLLAPILGWLAKGIKPAGEIGQGIMDIISTIPNMQDMWNKSTKSTWEKIDGTVQLFGRSIVDLGRLGLQGIMLGTDTGDNLRKNKYAQTQGQKAFMEENEARKAMGLAPNTNFFHSIFGPMKNFEDTAEYREGRKRRGPGGIGPPSPYQAAPAPLTPANAALKQTIENRWNITITATNREGMLQELRDTVSQAIP